MDRVGIIMVLGGKVANRSKLLPSPCRKILVRFNDDYTDPRVSFSGGGLSTGPSTRWARAPGPPSPVGTISAALRSTCRYKTNSASLVLLNNPSTARSQG